MGQMINCFLTKKEYVAKVKLILGETLDPRLLGKISLTGVFLFHGIPIK